MSSLIICKFSIPDQVNKKIKDNPSGESKWTTKGGTYITTEDANIWFNLLNLPPVTCSNTSSKSLTAMPGVHPMTSSLDATQ
jgi:hypothetical protein